MITTEINVLEEIELDNPIFIEALPGLGHVGKLAADHMIDELGATKFAEIHSPTFPPQVIVKDEGIIENMKNELYCLKDVGEDHLDLIILVGNTQALSPEGQYLVCKEILEFVSDFNIDRDKEYILPFLKSVFNKRQLKLLASPWSPPKFMKTNKMLILGGRLLNKYKQSYPQLIHILWI